MLEALEASNVKALQAALLRMAEQRDAQNVQHQGFFSYSPFCGLLEQAIRSTDETPKLTKPWTPEKIQTERELSLKHESQHQTIVQWMIKLFGIQAQLEEHVNERFAIYLKDDPTTTKEERYPSARETVINRYLNSISDRLLKTLPTIVGDQ